MKLLELKYNVKKNAAVQMAMRGINYSAGAGEGELAESKNVSARKYPYLTTRRHRAKQTGYSGVTALSAWEKLIAVSGTDLLYDGTPVGKVTSGEKQFAVVNNKLVIFPDKVYLDLTDMQLKPIDIELGVHKATFTTDTLSGYFGPAKQFTQVGISRVSTGATDGDVIAVGGSLIGNASTRIKFDGLKIWLKRQVSDEWVDDDWGQLLSEGDKIVLYFWGLDNGTDANVAPYIRQWEVYRAGLGYITFKLPGGRYPTQYSEWRSGYIQIWAAADDSLTDVIAYRKNVFRLKTGSTSYDKSWETLEGSAVWPGLGPSHVRIKRESGGANNELTQDTYIGAPEDLSDILKDIDTITISGCETLTDNNKAVNITELTSNSIKTTANAFEAGDEAVIKVSRKAPDLDYICSHENRLWGCNSEEQTIYISALGDPLNFITFEGAATDSYAVAVASPGNFTGCHELGSAVLFWKSDTLHKILGSYPAEYTLYTYSVEGVKAGCHKSQQVINDTLYYLGEHGVFAYNGGYPGLISANFGERVFGSGVAGNDGDSYYLSVMEGDIPHFLVYETRYGLWIREDNMRAVDFARIGKTLFCADDNGDVYILDDGEEDPDIDWIAQFAPVYETIEGRKVYSKINLRLQLPKGSYLIAETRIDGQIWREAGRALGEDADVVSMRIAFNRCDKFELRLSGHGPCVILGIMREFSVGSDR